MAAISEISTQDDLNLSLKNAGEKLFAAVFSASWHPPSQQLVGLLPSLSKDFSDVAFMTVDVGKGKDLAKTLGVSSIPTCVVFHKTEMVAKIVGFNPPELISQLKQLSANVASGTRLVKIEPAVVAPTSAAPAPASTPEAPTEDATTDEALKKLTSSAPVMLFMKGSKHQPFCKFSRMMVEILNGVGVEYDTFDILMNEAVRQRLKEFSQWPTYPQLYVKGELIGGVDIAREMAADGSLAELLTSAKQEAAAAAAQPKVDSLTERLKKLVSRAPVMLFMKGDPDAPRCGFSNQIVGMLREAGVAFEHFDILSDEDVRQGLKAYSNWPTYPQLYSGGELVGGLDVVKELVATGGPAALKEELEAAAAEGAAGAATA
eukprot:GDKH01025418.1.p1 GENE.GDKH01025418.1~~GDKH01025418.1.p1  ORF type:complete len:375 (-),score=95.83 GDKH01025418.1:76-1200(-)